MKWRVLVVVGLLANWVVNVEAPKRICLLAGEPAAVISLAQQDSADGRADEAHGSKTGDPHFELAERCSQCHDFSSRSQSQRDQQGHSVAAFDLWQSSMMAQSSRDPYWRAVVSAEVHNTPSQKAHLEEICTRCHTPMAAPFPPSPDGEILKLLTSDTRRAQLAMDGVSCTVCHQIMDTNLGHQDSFTGNFEINTRSLIYGPHADPFAMPMRNHVGYTPTYSRHILKSALCATCHTVITEAVTSDGQQTGVHFHEQAPYLEWRNSVFNDEIANPDPAARSCQSCHLPTTGVDGEPIKTRLAHNPGGRDFPFLNAREPFGRHTLVGGNALMTRILRDNAKKLGIQVPTEAFDRSLAEIEQMLRHETVKLEIGEISLQKGQMSIPVTASNLTGHKLPTAYPSRRAWLKLQVWDADGRILFVSGAFNGRGQLVDDENRVLSSEQTGGETLPHYQQISDSQQVQVYESIMSDVDGMPTFYLLQGARFLKDNRLLPSGWRSDHADAQNTRPIGVDADPDFGGGGDRVIYMVPMAGRAPYRVQASMHFQTISARHATELFVHDTPEVRMFKDFYEAADLRPQLVAEQHVEFEPRK